MQVMLKWSDQSLTTIKPPHLKVNVLNISVFICVKYTWLKWNIKRAHTNQSFAITDPFFFRFHLRLFWWEWEGYIRTTIFFLFLLEIRERKHYIRNSPSILSLGLPKHVTPSDVLNFSFCHPYWSENSYHSDN